MKNIKATDIIELLSYRHSKDVFVPECKTGETIYGCVRLDAWVMIKSWSNMNIIGYEVKVSRQDFLNDKKWTSYLPYVNSMYFVCPTGLIQPEELPHGIGLIWVSKTGTKLYTKRKAITEKKEIPIEIFQYILTWRTTVQRESNTGDKSDSVEYWKKWLTQCDEEYYLGQAVSKKLKQKYEKDVISVRNENKKIEERMSKYEDIKKFLEKIGLDPNSNWISTWKIEDKLKKLKEIIPEGMEHNLNRLIDNLANFKESIDNIKNNKE